MLTLFQGCKVTKKREKNKGKTRFSFLLPKLYDNSIRKPPLRIHFNCNTVTTVTSTEHEDTNSFDTE